MPQPTATGSRYTDQAVTVLNEEVEDFRITLGEEAERVAKRQGAEMVLHNHVKEARTTLYRKPSRWLDVHITLGSVLFSVGAKEAIDVMQAGSDKLYMGWVAAMLVGLGLYVYAWMAKG